MKLRSPANLGALFLWPLWLAHHSGSYGQTASEDALDMPLVSVAWDAGCLTRDDCAALAAAFQDQPQSVLTQQAVASELATSRALTVVQCLLELPEWQEAFRQSALAPGRRPGTNLRLRADLTKTESSMALSFRSKSHSGSDLGCRATLFQGRGQIESGCLKTAGPKSAWWFGTLAAGFGQGLVLWTPSPFDDIGGMEGSHRIGRGIRPASFRQRGVWNGIGWQERNTFSSHWRPKWAIVGQTWPDQKKTAALGGRRGRMEWMGRVQELMEGGWAGLAGIQGEGSGHGWSLRWAAAAFGRGWVGRMSALKTWSRVWEAHLLLERNHPQHPKWRSGEVRATPLDPEALPGLVYKGGLAFNGKWRGWARMEVKWWGPPPHRLRRQTSLRIERGGHRLDVKTLLEPGRASGTESAIDAMGAGQWSVQWRTSNRPANRDGLHWRWSISAAGKGESVGIAVAFMASWRTSEKGRWRLGLAQSIGEQGAPVRYLQGWDGRPSEPFSQSGFKSFVRWSSANGTWCLRLRMGWSWDTSVEELDSMSLGVHAFRVEFKPSWLSVRQG